MPAPFHTRLRLAALVGAATLALAACLSTGVVPLDADTYQLSKRGPQPGLGRGTDVKSDVERDAVSFCGLRGLRAETVEMTFTEPTWATPTHVTLRFRCVTAAPTPAPTAAPSN